MKVGGVQITKCEEVLVLPRPSGDLVFKAVAVDIADEFISKCSLPVAPMVITKNGKEFDYSDSNYKQAMAIRDARRFALLAIRSLEPSNIEWEAVDYDKPGTWEKWSDELKEAGLSEVELNRIVATIMAANSLDEEKIAKARADFLRGQGQ